MVTVLPMALILVRFLLLTDLHVYIAPVIMIVALLLSMSILYWLKWHGLFKYIFYLLFATQGLLNILASNGVTPACLKNHLLDRQSFLGLYFIIMIFPIHSYRAASLIMTPFLVVSVYFLSKEEERNPSFVKPFDTMNFRVEFTVFLVIITLVS